MKLNAGQPVNPEEKPRSKTDGKDDLFLIPSKPSRNLKQ
jgi:hypothetical protein